MIWLHDSASLSALGELGRHHHDCPEATAQTQTFAQKLEGRVLHLLLKPEDRVDTFIVRNKRGAFQALSIRLPTNLSLLASVAEAPAPRS
jgi:hypothetical protein